MKRHLQLLKLHFQFYLKLLVTTSAADVAAEAAVEAKETALLALEAAVLAVSFV